MKVKYTLSICQILWKYTSKVYLKHTSSVLEVYFKYTSSIVEVYFKYPSTWWITEEELYFKFILFWQKKYIWSTFCEIKGLFIWDETSHLCEMSHLSEILYMPHLHEKYIPPEWDSFHPNYPACLFLRSYVTFIVYLFQFQFTYLFQFQITNENPHC